MCNFFTMNSKTTLCSFLIVAFLSAVACDSCVNPQVSSTFYTTQDLAVVTQTAFITEFSIKCGNSLPPNFALYAEVEGKTMPAARTGENKYQVSWTEESARSGTREVRLYTEEGYTALRKALRSGETADSVQSLTSIPLSHSTGYTGPGINSEVMAAILSVVVAYAAITNKNKLLA